MMLSLYCKPTFRKNVIGANISRRKLDLAYCPVLMEKELLAKNQFIREELQNK
jgi:hypothetical protein